MACTSAPCAATGANSVKCQGSPNGVCTPTEAIAVGWDIIKGGSRLSGGQLTPSSCYSCLLSAGCIDGAGIKGSECGDLTGTVGAGAQPAQTKTDACLATLACILPSSGPGAGHSCANMPSDGISNCFCGAAATSAMACAALPAFTEPSEPGQPSGTCARQEFDGFGGVPGSTANMTLMRDYTKPSTGSGVANAILTCAGSNTGAMASCPQCFL
jgi:hypothetical protein